MPSGGIVRVELIRASDFRGARFDAAAGCFTSPETVSPFAGWSMREDGASYTEERKDDSGAPMIEHTLEMTLPGGPETRRAVAELSAASAGGLVAIVTTREGERLLAGYSRRFGTAYPLRLAAAVSAAGESPADIPSETIVLSSLDADRSLPLG